MIQRIGFINHNLLTNELKIEVYNVSLNQGQKRQLVKFLGIHVDTSLSLTYHGDIICKKLCKYVFTIHKITKIISSHATRSGYDFGIFSSPVSGEVIIPIWNFRIGRLLLY